MTPSDHAAFMDIAFAEAEAGYREGGVPVGSVIVRAGAVIGKGHNRREQEGDPILHGEMDALKQAGRQASYRDTVLYTTLSPCSMCTGAILLFKIPVVVIGENRNFLGEEDLLRSRGVDVVVLDDGRCVDLMARFIRERPELWNEDIAE